MIPGDLGRRTIGSRRGAGVLAIGTCMGSLGIVTCTLWLDRGGALSATPAWMPPEPWVEVFVGPPGGETGAL